MVLVVAMVVVGAVVTVVVVGDVDTVMVRVETVEMVEAAEGRDRKPVQGVHNSMDNCRPARFSLPL